MIEICLCGEKLYEGSFVNCKCGIGYWGGYYHKKIGKFSIKYPNYGSNIVVFSDKLLFKYFDKLEFKFLMDEDYTEERFFKFIKVYELLK
jgi:hypothetical protein